MRSFILAAVALLGTTTAAAAQLQPQRWIEFRPMAGAVVPTGAQRDVLQDAANLGLQLAWEYREDLHVVGTFAYSPGNHKFRGVTDNDVGILQYDIGAEFNLIRPLEEGWELKPFLGAGIGGRTYNYAEGALETTTAPVGYVTLGTELQQGAGALRLEVRDYLYRYDHPVRDEGLTRNDLAFSVGVAYHVGRHR